MDRHDLAHYGIAAVLTGALVASVVVVGGLGNRLEQTQSLARTALLQAPKGAARRLPGAWDALPRDKLHALVVQLAGVDEKQPVTIFCANESCAEIATDLNDALQLAGWSVIRFERRPVDSEADAGIFVGPSMNPLAKVLVFELQAQGLRASLTEIDGQDGVGIIIGQSH